MYIQNRDHKSPLSYNLHDYDEDTAGAVSSFFIRLFLNKRRGYFVCL